MLAASQAAGQGVPPLRDPNEALLRQQQERQRQDLLRQQSEGVQLDLPGLQGGVDDRAPQDIAEAGPVFSIGTIGQQGDALLTEAEFARIVAPFVGQPLGTARINALLMRINHALVAAGYTTSRAYVGAQDLSTGRLTVALVAGRIEKLLYNGQPLDAPGMAGVRLAMPMRQGDILRLPDIEQAVDQINRLRRNNAQVQIRPGQKPGGSIVEFVNAPKDAARYTLSADNQGTGTTGRLRMQAGWESGNLTGLMESLSAGLTSSRDTNAVYGTFSMPWGYGTISGLASWSEYQNLIGDVALVYGATRSYALSYGHLLNRDQNSKSALDVSLTRRQSSRYINDAALMPEVQTVLRLGVNRIKRFQTERGMGQWSVDAGLARGLPWFGAGRDLADLPPEAARYQFTKLEISGAWERPLTAHSAWRSRLATQWSNRPLYSSEQIFAGGVSSVRGFPESAWGADRGGYWRNEWIFKIPAASASRLRYEPYLFLDGARLFTLADRRWRNLAGTGAGVRAVYGKTSAELILGKPISRSRDIMAKMGWRINLSVTCSL
jgi:hemolysin activation/secretion protein